jgi:hypothetical protein
MSRVAQLGSPESPEPMNASGGPAPVSLGVDGFDGDLFGSDAAGLGGRLDPAGQLLAEIHDQAHSGQDRTRDGRISALSWLLALDSAPLGPIHGPVLHGWGGWGRRRECRMIDVPFLDAALTGRQREGGRRSDAFGLHRGFSTSSQADRSVSTLACGVCKRHLYDERGDVGGAGGVPGAGWASLEHALADARLTSARGLPRRAAGFLRLARRRELLAPNSRPPTVIRRDRTLGSQLR